MYNRDVRVRESSTGLYNLNFRLIKAFLQIDVTTILRSDPQFRAPFRRSSLANISAKNFFQIMVAFAANL